MVFAYRYFATDQQLYDIGSEGVSVFVQEAVNVVPYLTSVVLNRELRGIHSRPRIQFTERVIVMAFFEKRKVRCFREIAFVVQEMKNPDRFLSNQVDDWQIILWEK